MSSFENKLQIDRFLELLFERKTLFQELLFL